MNKVGSLPTVMDVKDGQLPNGGGSCVTSPSVSRAVTPDQRPSRGGSTPTVQPGLAAKLHDFVTNTTAHGFAHVAAARRCSPNQLLWIAITLLATVGNMVHMYFIVSQYLMYATVEQVTTSADQPLRFPDVTICPSQPYSHRSRNLDFVTDHADRLQILFEDVMDYYYDLTYTPDWYNLTDHLREVYDLTYNETEDRIKKIILDIDIIYENLTPSEAENAGFDLQSLIVKCDIRGQSCNTARDFVLFQDSRFAATHSKPLISSTQLSSTTV